MPIPNTVRADLIWRLNGADWSVNVLHFNRPSLGIQQQDADELAAVFSDNWSTISTWHDNGVTLHRVALQDVSVINGVQYTGDILKTGTNTGGSTSPLLSLCYQQYTGVNNRNGRIFHPHLAKSCVHADAGRPTVQAIEAFGEFWNAVLEDVPNATNLGSMVVVHRGSSDTSPVQSIGRTASSTAFGFQTQRRRRDGVVLF